MDTGDVQEAMVDILGFHVSANAAKLVFLVLVIVVAIVISRVLTQALRRIISKSNVPSMSIVINLLRLIVWSFALLAILQPVLGIEPSGFIAALGVTSVALSLGLQSTISNVFGGLSVMISKDIVPGDIVTINGMTGEVTDMTLRSTTVTLFNGDSQIIPNSVLSTTPITKLAPFQAGEFALPVFLAKDADLNEVRKEVDELARKALGTYYDEAFGTPLFIGEFNNFGVVASISLHVKPGISPGKARTAMADAIYGKPWLA